MLIKTSIKPLIAENNYRSEGYKSAAEKIGDDRLKQVFNRLSIQSRIFAEEVKRFPGNFKNGGNTLNSDQPGGNSAWELLKYGTFDRNTLLYYCENGECSIIKSYDTTLIETEEMPSIFQEVIIKQRNALQKAHDEIKSLRNTAL